MPAINDTASAKMDKSGFLRHTGALSVSVFLSRILGLLRDIVMSAVLGGGVHMSAWVQASTFANIMRQILGEGALGQALVPILAETLKNDGPEAARRKFTTIFIYLTLFLCFICVIVTLPMYLLVAFGFFTSPIWKTAAYLMPIVMPYMIFICTVGIMTSCMNMLRVFFLPSLTAVLQNLVIILAMLVVCPYLNTGWDKLQTIAFSVLLSGVLESLFMLWILHREKMQLCLFVKSVWTDRKSLIEIFSVALPGILASGTHAISTMADRLISGNIPKIAGEVGNYATAAIYYADRVVLFPIGIFAFAFGTVALTEMSRAHAEGNEKTFLDTMVFSLRTLMFITFPLTAFLYWYGREILQLFFLHGNFDMTCLEQSFWALQFYVFGIPAFASLKIISSAFTSRKDMKTPFYTGVAAIMLNIVLNLILMYPLRQGGITLATAVSSYANNFCLLYILRRQFGEKFQLNDMLVFLLKTIILSILPIIPSGYCYDGVYYLISYLHIPHAGAIIRNAFQFVYQAVPIGVAGIVYVVLLLFLGRLFRMKEAESVVSKVVSRLKRK